MFILKKAGALLCVICILISALFTFSCADKNPVDLLISTQPTDQDTQERTAEFEEPDYPEKDYSGREFNILYPEWGLYQHYFFADSETGEGINDAIYNRTTTVEDKLNIKLIRQGEPDFNELHNKLKKSVLAGDGAYDLVLAHCIYPLTAMITDNLMYNWYNIPFIDMSQPYWNSYNDELAVNGILPYAASDYIIPDPNGIFFNKDMIKAYDLEDPYELVKSGKWTWDKLTEMSRVAGKDLDGNGVYDESDQYGFMGELDWQFNGIRNAVGEKVISKTDDGHLVLNNYTDKTASIVQKIHELLFTGTTSFTWKHSMAYDPNHGGWPPVDFGEGHALFYLVPLGSARQYRATEVDFGILPFPKYDEAQQRYITTNWSGLMCVPATVSDPELVGIVSEMLAVESRKNVLPAYYDILLTSKVARDEESVEMLDIIYENCEYDLGLNYNGSNIWYMISQLMASGSMDIASFFEKNLPAEQKNLDKLYEAFQSYSH